MTVLIVVVVCCFGITIACISVQLYICHRRQRPTQPAELQPRVVDWQDGIASPRVPAHTGDDVEAMTTSHSGKQRRGRRRTSEGSDYDAAEDPQPAVKKSIGIASVLSQLGSSGNKFDGGVMLSQTTSPLSDSKKVAASEVVRKPSQLRPARHAVTVRSGKREKSPPMHAMQTTQYKPRPHSPSLSPIPSPPPQPTPAVATLIGQIPSPTPTPVVKAVKRKKRVSFDPDLDAMMGLPGVETTEDGDGEQTVVDTVCAMPQPVSEEEEGNIDTVQLSPVDGGGICELADGDTVSSVGEAHVHDTIEVSSVEDYNPMARHTPPLPDDGDDDSGDDVVIARPRGIRPGERHKRRQQTQAEQMANSPEPDQCSRQWPVLDDPLPTQSRILLRLYDGVRGQGEGALLTRRPRSIGANEWSAVWRPRARKPPAAAATDDVSTEETPAEEKEQD